MPSLSIPTASALPSTQLIPASHPAVRKTLHRLSRSSLLSLVLDWLDERNQENLAPYLADPEDTEDAEDDGQDLYPPAQSLPALREIYTELQARKGSKRDVVDRIIEGDWREGITLYQLAMADMQYLYDHPSSQKWTALKIVRLAEEDSTPSSKPASIPRFHPSTFLRNLQREVLPDVKAHYNLDRHTTLPLTILRIFIIESPYNTSAALHAQKQQATFDSSKTFYIAFPDASPYVYVSLSTAAPGQPSSTSENRSLRKLTLDGIPKAFSKPRERYKLESTSLSAKNLEALVERRGPNGTNAAAGGWGVYAEEKKAGRDHPLNVQLPTPEASAGLGDEEKKQDNVGMKRVRDEDERVVKRRKLIAQGRFGNSGKVDDGKGIERLDIKIEDPFPSDTPHLDEDVDDLSPEARTKKKKGRRSTVTFDMDRDEDDIADEGWRPDIRLTFHGSHIHAGIRELLEAGIIDGEKMPGWMTGEEGVSIGAVRDGRIRGHKGSGL